MIILQIIGWTFYLLPEPLRRFWVFCFGGVIQIWGARKKVVLSNLALCFPGQEKELLSKSYRHLARLILEMMMMFGPMPRFVKAHTQVKGLENWHQALARKKGVIMISSHVGNWEIAAAACAMSGQPSLMVTKHLKPEWLHQGMIRGRLRCGVRGTYEPKTMKDILRQLQNNLSIGMVVDQYAGAPVGVRVPFFGQNVGTHSAVAMIARRTGAAVVSMVNHRNEDGSFLIEIGPIIEFENQESDDALARQTAVYAAVLEEHVRSFREQWLWVHRRFKGNLGPLLEGEWSQIRSRT